MREAFPRPQEIPPQLNTAFVYLGNAEAQAGYEAAVQATSAIKSQLEGQTEKLMARRTMAGGVAYTNRPTQEPPLSYAFGLPEPTLPDRGGRGASRPSRFPVEHTHHAAHRGRGRADLFGFTPQDLDALQPEPAAKPARAQPPSTREEVLAALAENRLKVYHRKRDPQAVPTLGDRLKTEEKPEFVDLSAISRQVAQSLPISPALQRTALQVALNRMTQKELHKELTTGQGYIEEIQVVTDRQALAREAVAGAGGYAACGG